ncbi:MAG: hypothetical protein WC501_03060 [Candidatus Micrarchaeia archaeon]
MKLKHITSKIVGTVMITALLVFGCHKAEPDRNENSIITSLREGSGCLLQRNPAQVLVTNCNALGGQMGACPRVILVDNSNNSFSKQIVTGNLPKLNQELSALSVHLAVIREKNGKFPTTEIQIENKKTSEMVNLPIPRVCSYFFDGIGYIE